MVSTAPQNAIAHANEGSRVTTQRRDMNEAEWAGVLEECYARVLRALVGVSGSRETAEDGLPGDRFQPEQPAVAATAAEESPPTL